MENKAVQCKFTSPSSKKERTKETTILYSFLSPPSPGFWSAFSRKPLDTSLAPRDQSVHLFSTAMWGVRVGVGHVVSESIYFYARGCWDTTFANSYYSGTPVVYSQINTKITVWKRSNPPSRPHSSAPPDLWHAQTHASRLISHVYLFPLKGIWNSEYSISHTQDSFLRCKHLRQCHASKKKKPLRTTDKGLLPIVRNNLLRPTIVTVLYPEKGDHFQTEFVRSQGHGFCLYNALKCFAKC